jgi:hypothetical protein
MRVRLASRRQDIVAAGVWRRRDRIPEFAYVLDRQEVTRVYMMLTRLGLAIGVAMTVLAVAAMDAAGVVDRARPREPAAGFTLVGTPIAVYGRDVGQPIYFVYVRLSRAVPRNSNGSLAAAVRLGGLGLSRPPTSSSMGFLSAPSRVGHHCYEQQLVLPQGPYPPKMGDPRPGRRLSVEVFIRGRSSPLRATVTLRRRAARTGAAKRYLRELHC